MSAKILCLRRLSRFTAAGISESLDFEPGLNLIEGPKDSGKTKWLLMLNYLFGDPDPPEQAFGDVATRYIKVRGEFQLGDAPFILERTWTTGLRSKVLVNGEAVPVDEFSDLFLNKLNIPVLRFPKGSPYNASAWPRLSWRMMLRHVFRGEHDWGDLVPKQPEPELHACLLQFLGVASKIYPIAYETQIEKQKEVWKLEVTRDEIDRVLNEVTLELVRSSNMSVAITTDSLEASIRSLRGIILEKEAERNRLLDGSPEESDNGPFRRLRLRWAEAEEGVAEVLQRREAAVAKLRDYEEYGASVRAEIERLERARIAGQLLADLKVTHCPVCEQEVQNDRFPISVCNLCGQPRSETAMPTTVSERIEFERA